MTKDAGAHVTCHHHPGIIRVTSHWMKVSECVGISYVSNMVLRDFLRSANARSYGRPCWRGDDKYGVINIVQDDGSFDTRTMRQRVREQGCPRTMTRWMIPSSEVEK